MEAPKASQALPTTDTNRHPASDAIPHAKDSLAGHPLFIRQHQPMMVFPEPLVQVVEEYARHAGLKKSTLLWIASLTELINASFHFPSTHKPGLVTNSCLLCYKAGLFFHRFLLNSRQFKLKLFLNSRFFC